MLTYARKAGTADVSVVIRIIDSTDGTPETGVVWNTSGIDLEYRREGAVSVDITEVTLAALTTAHTDGGFLHIGNGYYRLDLPDAACAAGSVGVLIHGIVTGMVVIGCYIQLVACDPFDAVRLGLTALPNAAADGVGGLPISDAGGLDIDAKLANTNEVTAARMGALTDLIDGGRLDLILDARASQASIDVIDGIVDTIVARVIGTLATGTHNPQSGDAFARLGAPAGASVSADIAAIEAQTDDIGAAGAGLTAVPDSAGVTTLLSRIPATLFSGITSLAQWLGLLGGKQAGNTTARTELRATGAGAGTFDELADSLEAIRDTAPLGTAMRGTDNAALASVCTETRMSELDAGTPGKAAAEIDLIKTDAAAILVDTGTTLDGRIPAALVGGKIDANVGSKTVGVALTAQEKTDVNAEVVDALATDTYAEPGQGAPAATISLAVKLGHLYKEWRNKKDNDGSTVQHYADNGTTIDQKRTVAEAAGTVTMGEVVSGP